MTDRSIVAGSERTLLPGSRVVGDADPAEHATVTVFVRSRHDQDPPAGTLSHEAFASGMAPAPKIYSGSKSLAARTA